MIGKLNDKIVFIGEATELEALKNLLPEGTVINCDTQEARTLCAVHIGNHYPTYLQLNILRAGTPNAIEKMGKFIDACRTWSNGANPDPKELAAIIPGDT